MFILISICGLSNGVKMHQCLATAELETAKNISGKNIHNYGRPASAGATYGAEAPWRLRRHL